ncbi:MAG TPA: RHS repeat-associated core domain-containing protein [Allosphingosinicella sp.]|jgi:RHS repeat-associated protein
MTRTRFRAGVFACALLAGTALCTPAFAQSGQSAEPAHRAIDANGVNLVDGSFPLVFNEGTIGSGAGALSIERHGSGAYNASNWQNIYAYQTISGSVTTVAVTLGAASETFTSTSGGAFVSARGDGAKLTGGNHSDFTYTGRDGTVVTFGAPADDQDGASNLCSHVGANQNGCTALAASITKPNAATIGFTWDVPSLCSTTFNPDGSLDCTYAWRLSGVSNSAGYAAAFTFVSNTVAFHQLPSGNWFKRSGVTLTNANVSGASSSIAYSYVSSTVTDVTDAGGRTWRLTNDSANRITGVRAPGSSSDDVSVVYGTGGSVTSVTKSGVATTYSRSVSGSTATTIVTDALSHTTTVVANTGIAAITSVTDSLSRTTSFTYDSSARLTRTTYPEGNYINLTYDARGNVTETRGVAKSGSGLSDVVATASYDSSCTNVVKCNSPNSVTDARGNTTDFTYDSTHGGVLGVTAPAPTSGAVRPQTRYSYTLTGGAYHVTAVSACQTTSSCAGGSDEAKTTAAYDSNGNVTSTTSGDGTGTLAATTAMTYDGYGNLLTVDGPLSGSADTVRYRYNAARQAVGVIGPDPDGSGALKNRAVRTTYDSAGRVTKVERGTVNSQSDSDWAAFASLQETDTGYDSYHRPITQSRASGSTTYALTQTSYDGVGRVQCVAQRMNPTYFGSLPSDACTLGTASTSYGNDRIVKTTYDNAGQVTLVQTAYGVTGTQADEVTTTYTNNGKTASVTDAEGNKTSYVYDGLDQLYQTQYPSGTKGAGTSNSSDYEQLGYDAGGNITSRRLRDGNSIAFTFDALGRMTYKDLPGTEPDVTYTYDGLSRMTSAATSSQTLSFTYDALSRNLTQVGPQGTASSAWDLAGRRTRITHPDGFYVDQDYLVTGELAHIRENGAASGVGVLATYAYDDLGRRSSITRGDASTTGYTYDNASRLTQLVEDVAGTSYDQTLGFSYNPASQITSNTRSNDNYAWTGHYNVNRGYTANGLNQYTASGSVTPTYDTKGNLTSAGSTTYGYSSENLLTSATGGITLAYDPAMRLYQTAGGTPGTTRFQYDGTALIAEYNSSNSLQRRFVHGPGTDEPIVWYEGSGTTDRRFLHQDERGSVVAVTNSSGSVLTVNTYDEYGIPRSSNSGRFQYTGQTLLPELGMYYYKARIYSPTLGRFMQTDPMRYGAGMNLYAYVTADPGNRTDPLGLQGCPSGSHWENDPGSRLGGCVMNADSDGGGGGSGGAPAATGGAGGGKFRGGGPLDGQTECDDCLKSMDDPRFAESVAAHGGAYFQQVWVRPQWAPNTASDFLNEWSFQRSFGGVNGGPAGPRVGAPAPAPAPAPPSDTKDSEWCTAATVAEAIGAGGAVIGGGMILGGLFTGPGEGVLGPAGIAIVAGTGIVGGVGVLTKIALGCK